MEIDFDEFQENSSTSDIESNIQERLEVLPVNSKVKILNVESASCNDFLMSTLFEQIKELQNALKRQSQHIKSIEESFSKTGEEFKNLKEALKKYFSTDQIDFLMGKKPKWQNSTVQKGLTLRYKLGQNFYDNTFRKFYAPYWPSSTTCARRIKEFKLPVGILKFNIDILGYKFLKFPVAHRVIGLIFDEKAIIPSQQRDYSINEYRGKVTLLPSKKVIEKEGTEPLAKHALVALAVGMDEREKEIVGLQYTAGATDGNAMKNFIFELIIHIETNSTVLVDWIGFDLSPTNASFLKSCGISLSKDNLQYHIQHPARPNDKLYLQSDVGHDEKNIIAKLRLTDVGISYSLVQKFNLSSNKASFNEVKKIYNMQKKMDKIEQPAKKLKQQHMKPNHFETMKQYIASDVLSSDISSTIEFLDIKSANNGKKNTTAWLLQTFLKFHNIFFDKKGWTLENRGKFEEDKGFLLWMTNEFLVNLKFSNCLKCIPGLIMSIRTLVDLADKYFAIGFKRVIPARFLNDAIENIFSLVVDIVKKPTALSIAQALRIISINQFQYNSVKGSYDWDETAENSIDFIGMLKLFLEKEDDDDKDQLSSCSELNVLDKIPNLVTSEMLFDNALKFNVFYCEMCGLFNNFLNSVDCLECKNQLIADDNFENSASKLFKMRQAIEKKARGSNYNQHQLSSELISFAMRLEFVFREICKTCPADDKNFEDYFYLNTDEISMSNAHCFTTSVKLISTFLKMRRNSAVQTYLPHKSIKHASKGLI
jgi:hypothetical protein